MKKLKRKNLLCEKHLLMTSSTKLGKFQFLMMLGQMKMFGEAPLSNLNIPRRDLLSDISLNFHCESTPITPPKCTPQLQTSSRTFSKHPTKITKTSAKTKRSGVRSAKNTTLVSVPKPPKMTPQIHQPLHQMKLLILRHDNLPRGFLTVKKYLWHHHFPSPLKLS